jgi:hypothetical protein
VTAAPDRDLKAAPSGKGDGSHHVRLAGAANDHRRPAIDGAAPDASRLVRSAWTADIT